MRLRVGSVALAVDTRQVSLLRRHLQRAADSGALAGAYAKVQTKDVTAAVNKALTFNDAFPLASPATITQPTTGTHANRAVRVALSAKRSLPFWSLFGSEPTVNVESMAALVYSGQYCMVSLDEGTGTGITFGGNATVNLGCGVISNTSGANAVTSNGNAAEVRASPIAAVGGVPSSGIYKQPTLLLPYSLKQEDPFKDIPVPPDQPQGSCKPQIVDSTSSITPGCYRGVDVDKAKTFAPGVYYIVGPFTLNSKADITAEGVTFVFTREKLPGGTYGPYPTIAINGSARLNLTAPESGTYEGIVMHYDGRAPAGSHMINGNSTTIFEGAFYFPTQHLTFNGNSDMTTNCIQLVAFRLTFEGNTEIDNDCDSDGGGAQAFDAEWVRLVK